MRAGDGVRRITRREEENRRAIKKKIYIYIIQQLVMTVSHKSSQYSTAQGQNVAYSSEVLQNIVRDTQ